MNEDVLDQDNKPNKEPREQKVFRNVLFSLAFVFVCAGMLFRILHWPFANLLILFGLGMAVTWIVWEVIRNLAKK